MQPQFWPGEHLTWDIVTWQQTRKAPLYRAGLYWAPDKADAECRSRFFAASTVSELGGMLNQYLAENIARADYDEDQFGLLNLPCSEEEPGGYILSMFGPQAPFYGLQPLPETEFMRLRKIVAKEHPLLWGLPANPYKDKPSVSEEEAERNLLAMWEIAAFAVRTVCREKGVAELVPLELYRLRHETGAP